MEKRAETKKGILNTVLLTIYAPLSYVFFPAALFQPSLYVFVRFNHGLAYIAVAVVASAVALWLLGGWLWAVAFVCLLMLGSMAMIISIRRQRPAFESLVTSVGVFLCGALLMHYAIVLAYGMDFISVLSGQVTAWVQQAREGTVAAKEMEAYYLMVGVRSSDALMRFLSTGASGVSFDTLVREMLALVQQIENLMRLVMPLVFMLFAMAMGLVNQTLSRAMIKRTGVATAQYPLLRDMRLPTGFGWGALGLYAAAIILELANIQGVEQMAVTISGMMSFIFAVQGVAFLDWLMHSRKFKRPLRVVVEVAAVLLLGTILAYLGIMEQVINFRKPRKAE